MAKVTLKNGMVVNFSGDPTPEDIAFVEKQYGTTSAPEPKKSTTEKIGNALGSIFGGKAIGDFLGTQAAKGTFGKTIQKVTTGLSDEQLANKDIQKYLQESKGPSGKELVGDVASVASNFIPVGKLAKGAKAALGVKTVAKEAGNIAKIGNFLKKGLANIGVGAGTGYVAETSRDLAEGKDDAFKIGSGTIIGGGIPVAGWLAGKIPSATKGFSALATGVPRETLKRATDPMYAKRIEGAIKEIGENEKQPFFSLAKKVASGISAAEERATTALKTAVNDFIKANPKVAKTFDVRPQMTELRKSLWPFRDSGLIVSRKKVGTKAGQDIFNYSVKNSPQGAFTEREIGALNGLLGKINSAKKIGVRDVLALRKSFSTAYDAIPLGNNGQPTPYHAAVMAMKSKAEDIIDEILPEALKTANGQYRRVAQLKDTFGNRVVDASGKLKDNAEQYIANLGNMNKEQIRREIGQYADDIGMDLADEVQVIKDAQRLAELFPRTGSRTLDVIRSLAVSGLGLSTGLGAPGAVAGLAVASPKVAGKVATTIGKTKPAVRRAQELASQLTGIRSGSFTPGDALLDILKGTRQTTKKSSGTPNAFLNAYRTLLK